MQSLHARHDGAGVRSHNQEDDMRPNMVRVIIGGFIATFIFTVMMFFVSPIVTGGPADIAGMLATRLGGSRAAGMLAHLTIGTLILPAFYAKFFFERLSGSAAVRGMTWGLMLWIVAQTIVMPLVGGGFFSSNMGGTNAAIDSLLGHMMYGFVFGAIAGGARETLRHSMRTLAPRSALRRAH
jgi:hypothetical protein